MAFEIPNMCSSLVVSATLNFSLILNLYRHASPSGLVQHQKDIAKDAPSQQLLQYKVGPRRLGILGSVEEEIASALATRRRDRVRVRGSLHV